MNVQDILRTNQLEISATDTLSSVFGKLSKGHTEALVVDEKGHYVGMLSKRMLLKSRIDASITKAKNYVMKTATLTNTTTLERAAELLNASDTHVLPVLNGEKVIGICGARDVLASLQSNFGTRKAIELGSTKLVVLQEGDAIVKALALLREKHIDRIPVVDKNGKLSGIISVIDILLRYGSGTPHGAVSGRNAKQGKTSHSGGDAGDRPDYTQLPVSNIMTKIVTTCSPNAKAADVIKLLNDQGISSVILVQQDLPVGIVTTKDLLREVTK